MTIKNFPSDIGWTVGAGSTDTTPINLGTKFGLSASANVNGVRFYSPTSQTVTIQLWDVAGATKLAERTGQSAATGWNTFSFTAPYAATTGIEYMVSVLISTGSSQYTARTPSFTDGTNPVLVTVAPASSNSSSNGAFAYSATAIPSGVGGGSGPWYGIDVVIDDLAGNGSVTAVVATGSGVAVPPFNVGLPPTIVAAVRAQGTGAGQAPSVTGVSSVTGGGPAAGSGAAGIPVVVGQFGVTVTAVRAQGSGLVRPPTVVGGTVTTLPVVVTHGAVKAWLGSGVNVSPDADGYADLIPDVGTVTFTPVAQVLTFPTATPAPLVLTPRVVVCTLDTDGYLIGTKTGATEKLVRLIAGDWTVSFQLTGVTLPTFKVTITGGATIDLADVMPL